MIWAEWWQDCFADDLEVRMAARGVGVAVAGVFAALVIATAILWCWCR